MDTPIVNTLHHQALRDIAPGLRVTGRAPDGVVEAVEGTGTRLRAGRAVPPRRAMGAATARARVRGFVEAGFIVKDRKAQATGPLPRHAPPLPQARQNRPHCLPAFCHRRRADRGCRDGGWLLGRNTRPLATGVAQTAKAGDLSVTMRIDEAALGPRVIDLTVKNAAGSRSISEACGCASR